MTIDSSKNWESDSQLLTQETVTEKYNSVVKVFKHKTNQGYVSCEIGNSGFEVRFPTNTDKIKFNFDYYPNIPTEQWVEKRKDISLMFGSALLSFRNWLNDPVNEKEYGFTKKNLLKMSNFTNYKMADFIRRLFSDNGHSEMVKIDDSNLGLYISIDINNFCNLKRDDKLIQTLEKMDQNAQEIRLTYKKAIH